jgi:hypothetical protein
VRDDPSEQVRNGLLLAGGSLVVLALLLSNFELRRATPWLLWCGRAFVTFPLLGLALLGLDFASPALPSRSRAALDAPLRGRCLGCGCVTSSAAPCEVCGAPPMRPAWESTRRYGAAAFIGGIAGAMFSGALALGSVPFDTETPWVARGVSLVFGAALFALGYKAAQLTRSIWRAARNTPEGFETTHHWTLDGHSARTALNAARDGDALVFRGETRVDRPAPEVEPAEATPFDRSLAWTLHRAVAQKWLYAAHLTLHRWTLRAGPSAAAHYREGATTPHTHEVTTGVRVGPRDAVDEALTSMGAAPETLRDDGGEVWMHALRDTLHASPEAVAKITADEAAPEEFRDEKLRHWLRALRVREP